MTRRTISAAATGAPRRLLPAGRKLLGRLGTVFFVLLLLLSPVKQASMVSGEGGLWPATPLEWIFLIWPCFLAPVWAGAGLLLVLTYAPLPPLAAWRRDLPLLLPAWGLVLACLVGLIATTETDEARQFFWHVWSVATLVLALWLHVRAQPQSKRWLLAAIVAAALWVAYDGWEQYFYGLAELRKYSENQAAASGAPIGAAMSVRLYQDRVFATFTVPNSYAAHLLLVLPLTLVLLARWGRALQPPRHGLVLAGLLVAAALVGTGADLYWSGSRAALLALGAMLLVLAVAVGRRDPSLVRRYRLVLILGGLAALLAVGGAFLHLQRQRSGSAADFRLAYYQDALKTFAVHPLTGGGLGEFLSYHLRFKPAWLNEEAKLVHNTVLQFLAECGIVGGLAALLFCGQVLWVAWELRRGRWRAEGWGLSLALLLGLLGWQLHSQLDFDFHVPASVWLAACFPLLVVDWTSLSPAQPVPASRAWGGRALLLAVAFLCLWPLTRIPGEAAYVREQAGVDARLPAVQVATLAMAAAARLPHSPHPWWTLADAALMQRDFITAESAARRATVLVPRLARSYSQLAMALAGQQRWTEALAAIDEALTRAPTSSSYHSLRQAITDHARGLPMPDNTPNTAPQQP